MHEHRETLRYDFITKLRCFCVGSGAHWQWWGSGGIAGHSVNVWKGLCSVFPRATTTYDVLDFFVMCTILWNVAWLKGFTDETWSKYISNWWTYNKDDWDSTMSQGCSFFFFFGALILSRCFCCWSFYQDLLFRFHCDPTLETVRAVSPTKKGRESAAIRLMLKRQGFRIPFLYRKSPTWDDTTPFTWSYLLVYNIASRWVRLTLALRQLFIAKLWGLNQRRPDPRRRSYWRLAQSLLIDRKQKTCTHKQLRDIIAWPCQTISWRYDLF